MINTYTKKLVDYTEEDINLIEDLFNTNDSIVLLEIKKDDDGKSLNLYFNKNIKNINEDEKMKSLNFECCGGGLDKDGRNVDIYQKIIDTEPYEVERIYISPKSLYLEDPGY